MECKELSKDDSLILKGLAILAIMLHNLFRWIPPLIGENEFGFSHSVVYCFGESLVSQPQEFINIIFSYLGHFGVQAFILLSGYGLTKSMLAKPTSWSAFMGNRLKKIYPLLLIAIAGYVLFSWAVDNYLPTGNDKSSIVYKLLIIHTMMPYEGISICGPWWFFGLIMQLYILFPILLNLSQKYGPKILILTTVASYVWFFSAFYYYEHDLLLAVWNAPGHLPEFCFGIWLAMRGNVVLSRWWLLPAFAVFILGNFFAPFYPFTFLAASIIILICYNTVNQFIIQHNILKNPLVFFGSISMYLFAIHGFMRRPFADFATSHGNAAITLLTALAFVSSATAISLIIKPLHRLILWLLNLIKIPVLLKADKFFKTATLLTIAVIAVYYIVSPFQKYCDIELKQSYMTKEGWYNSSNDISPDTLYSDLLWTNLGQCGHIKITIDAEIDTHESEPDHIPLLATEVCEVNWDKFYLPKTDGFEKIHFERTFYSSLFDRRKEKILKIYFWNIDGTSMKFRNAEVKISYQKWRRKPIEKLIK